MSTSAWSAAMSGAEGTTDIMGATAADARWNAGAEEPMVRRLVWEFFCQVVVWFVAGSLFGGVSR